MGRVEKEQPLLLAYTPKAKSVQISAHCQGQECETKTEDANFRSQYDGRETTHPCEENVKELEWGGAVIPVNRLMGVSG